VRDRVVYYGGKAAVREDSYAWALELRHEPKWVAFPPARWPAGPDSRFSSALLYDPLRDRMIMTAGTYGASWSSDVWAISMDPTPRWSLLSKGEGGFRDHGGQQAVIDVSSDRLLVFITSYNIRREGQGRLYGMSLRSPSSWSLLSTTDPPPEGSHAGAAFDPSRQELLMTRTRDGTWSLLLSHDLQWQFVSPWGTHPGHLHSGTAIHDPGGDRVIAVRGTEDSGASGLTLWSLDLGERPRWMNMESSPGGPSPRLGHAVVHDSRRNRMIVIGGVEKDPVTRRERYLNDIWAVDLPDARQWIPLAPTGLVPEGRAYHSLAYDPKRGRIIMYGGDTGDRSPFQPLDDLWSLELDPVIRWTKLDPSGERPRGRFGHSMVYDAHHHEMILFGGIVATLRNSEEAWRLAVSGRPRWKPVEPVSPAGTPPRMRFHGAIYDDSRRRMVVIGRDDFSDDRGTWALNLWARDSWQPLYPSGPQPERAVGAVVYDPKRDQVIHSSGSETGFLSFSPHAPSSAVVSHLHETSAEPAHAGVDAASDGRAQARIVRASWDPSRGNALLELSLQQPEAVSVELWDVAGRMRSSSQTPHLLAGVHHLPIPGVAEQRPGVYFVRVAFGERHVCLKLAIVR
jgi:hypothetical protein